MVEQYQLQIWFQMSSLFHPYIFSFRKMLTFHVFCRNETKPFSALSWHIPSDGIGDIISDIGVKDSKAMKGGWWSPHPMVVCFIPTARWRTLYYTTEILLGFWLTLVSNSSLLFTITFLFHVSLFVWTVFSVFHNMFFALLFFVVVVVVVVVLLLLLLLLLLSLLLLLLAACCLLFRGGAVYWGPRVEQTQPYKKRRKNANRPGISTQVGPWQTSTRPGRWALFHGYSSTNHPVTWWAPPTIVIYTVHGFLRSYNVGPRAIFHPSETHLFLCIYRDYNDYKSICTS